MNLFQNNVYKNEFIITNYENIDSDGGGFTLLAASDKFSISDGYISDDLVSAIKNYGGNDVLGGYSVQIV
ncbi:hypothetical protein I0F14_14510 [Klebsiella pneumoniae]|uniref:hypothetical protein n=1 Tax=Klebsiella pneumoniae TaxID=573 RepID=UPI0018A2E3E6|nr:hypothetical protein [Klebsiella pneumoniae]MBF7793120.1 hypothetical protein [Klebsiella pneumoniae]MBF7799240.1 hypothetical protein [Klebsiella pneumoniae]HCA6517865.1 hypothetical protein [Klebsiella pneumoniae]HCA6854172.1 hypothetical protein [Klebsiella pneumoniae]HCA6881056.1 hypothetical protein [Klebsiella pneumoniae]